MKFVIIANSEHVSKDFINAVSANSKIIALDGIADHLIAIGVTPYAIVGDFDSISKETIDICRDRGVILAKLKEQNSTDLDKGIKFCDEKKAKEILIINAFGGERVDHTLMNYRSLRRHYSSKRTLRIMEKNSYLELYKDCELSVLGTKGMKLSVLAFPKATITSDGLEYNMYNYTLELGYRESSSNSLKKDTAHIEIIGEALLIYDINCKISIR